MSQRIIRYFPDTDLRSGHDGLAKIAREKKIDVRSLGAGEYLVFTNSAKNKVKVFTGGNVIAYLKSKTKIDMRTIALIPKYFNGGEIRYDQALEKVLRKDLGIGAVVRIPTRTQRTEVGVEL